MEELLGLIIGIPLIIILGLFDICACKLSSRCSEEEKSDKKMTAKEMFEALGYEEIENDNHFLTYFHRGKLEHDKVIKFHKPDKSITFKDACGLNYRWINLRELKAINQQCKELGWLDE